MKILELKGMKSLRVLNVFSTLCVGMTMLPRFLTNQASAQDLMDAIEAMEPEDQENVMRELVEVVPLEPDEVEAVISFCTDPNGVPYSKANIKNLNPVEIVDCIVAVCMKVVEMKIHTVTDPQKKNSETSQLTL